MGKSNRLFILKLLNAAYRFSVSENAMKTQDYIARLINCFRYYLNDGQCKEARLKDEFSYLNAFLDIFIESTGKEMEYLINLDSDLENMYLPSGILVQLLIEILVENEEYIDKSSSITIECFSKNEDVIIRIKGNCFKRTGQLNESITKFQDNAIAKYNKKMDASFEKSCDNVCIIIKVS